MQPTAAAMTIGATEVFMDRAGRLHAAYGCRNDDWGFCCLWLVLWDKTR